MSLIIIDDYLPNLKLLDKMLRENGYPNVHSFLSAREALDFLGFNDKHELTTDVYKDIDAVITDINMPQMDGIELCKYLKAHESFVAIPIIMVTAYSEETYLQQAFQAGASDYIRKPYKVGELLFRIHAAIQQKQLYDKVQRHARMIEETKQLYQSLFHNSDIPTFFIDLTGRFVELNDAFLTLTKFSMEELFGQAFHQLFAAEAAETILQQLAIGQQISPLHLETEVLTKQLEKRLVLIDGAPVTVEGEVVGVIGTMKDVTLERQAEQKIRESEQLYRSLFEISPDAVLVHHDDTIVFANDRIKQLLGLESLDTLANKSLLEFVHPNDQLKMLAHLQKVQELEQTELIYKEFSFQANNQLTFVELVSRKISFKGQQAILTLIRNVSERKKLELQYRHDVLLAKNVHITAVPTSIHASDIQIVGRYIPTEQSLSDMMIWRKLDRNRYAVMIYDIFGEGVSTSLLCLSLRQKMIELLETTPEPYVFIKAINNYFNLLFQSYQENPAYMTCLYAIIHTKTNEIEYVNCGHPAAICVDSDDQVSQLKRGTYPIGLMHTEELAIDIGQFTYTAGTQLFMYSDGLFDVWSHQIDECEDRLVAYLEMNNDSEARANAIELEVIRSRKQHDDVSFILIQL